MNFKLTKNLIIIFIIAVLAVLICCTFLFGCQKIPFAKDNIATVSDQRIIEILKTNSDVAGYMNKNSDFQIQSKEILTKDSILAGQNGQEFQPVYIGLQLEDNRYMKVQLINSSGSEGYITVIDFSDSSVQKAFGLLLFQASANMISGKVQKVTAP